jgi:hypothetical protein
MPCICQVHRLRYRCGCKACVPDRPTYVCGNTKSLTGRDVLCSEAREFLYVTDECCPRHRNPGFIPSPSRKDCDTPVIPQVAPQANTSKMPLAAPHARLQTIPQASLHAILQNAPSVRPQAGLQVRPQANPQANPQAGEQVGFQAVTPAALQARQGHQRSHTVGRYWMCCNCGDDHQILNYCENCSHGRCRSCPPGRSPFLNPTGSAGKAHNLRTVQGNSQSPSSNPDSSGSQHSLKWGSKRRRDQR